MTVSGGSKVVFFMKADDVEALDDVVDTYFIIVVTETEEKVTNENNNTRILEENNDVKVEVDQVVGGHGLMVEEDNNARIVVVNGIEDVDLKREIVAGMDNFYDNIEEMAEVFEVVKVTFEGYIVAEKDVVEAGTTRIRLVEISSIDNKGAGFMDEISVSKAENYEDTCIVRDRQDA